MFAWEAVDCDCVKMKESRSFGVDPLQVEKEMLAVAAHDVLDLLGDPLCSTGNEVVEERTLTLQEAVEG